MQKFAVGVLIDLGMVESGMTLPTSRFRQHM